MSVRRGKSVRQVALRFGVAASTVMFWVKRAGSQRLSRIRWTDHSGHRPAVNRVAEGVEQCVLDLRKELKEQRVLGEFGADAIRHEMEGRGCNKIPARTTINRILQRNGMLDGKHRKRFTPPPKGWYWPNNEEQNAERDRFDYIEECYLKGGEVVHLLHGISLGSGLVYSKPVERMTAENTVQAIIEHGRNVGVPEYAPFDNGTVFHGPNNPDSIGNVSKLCLSLGVIPIFVPPHEFGFQAAIESDNGRGERAVWNRFTFKNIYQIQTQSDLYINAVREKKETKREVENSRKMINKNWNFSKKIPEKGTMIFIRRTDNKGRAKVMGHLWELDKNWTLRLIRATVDLENHLILFHKLRKKEPQNHCYIGTAEYHLPWRKYQKY
jgi:transposase-like protein